MTYRYDFSIAKLRLRVESPRALTVPENFRPFETAVEGIPDIRLEICFGSGRDIPAAQAFYWKDGESVLRQDPSQPGEPIRLHIPESFGDVFCRQGNWMLYLAPEKMLLGYDRLILHASAVIHQGKAYLFSAPSGGGKSTHAALWQSHYGAQILNGDKVVLHVQEGRCTAYGSPVAGSSGIYRNQGAPVAGVFILHKAGYNRLSRPSLRTSLLALYSETVKSGEDPQLNTRLLDLLQLLQSTVPVLSLECLPQKEAVDCILTNLEGMTQ